MGKGGEKGNERREEKRESRGKWKGVKVENNADNALITGIIGVKNVVLLQL